MLTFAIGDVHGMYGKLTRVMGECQMYAGDRPHRFVFTGDLVDRGPRSKEVVTALMRRQQVNPDRTIVLRGNHEAMLLWYVKHPKRDPQGWLGSGGFETIASYGAIGSEFNEELFRSHARWIERLPLFYDDGLRYFCHAGIDFMIPLAQQSNHTLLWERGPYDDHLNPGRLVVHGHTPVEKPEWSGHRLNIDTGSCFGGMLTAAVFNDKKRDPVAFISCDGRQRSPDWARSRPASAYRPRPRFYDEIGS